MSVEGWIDEGAAADVSWRQSPSRSKNAPTDAGGYGFVDS